MFIAALFILGKNGQDKSPSTDEWIHKMWYTCTMVYYSKRNGILICATTMDGY